jgi:hypothetical protein
MARLAAAGAVAHVSESRRIREKPKVSVSVEFAMSSLRS